VGCSPVSTPRWNALSAPGSLIRRVLEILSRCAAPPASPKLVAANWPRSRPPRAPHRRQAGHRDPGHAGRTDRHRPGRHRGGHRAARLADSLKTVLAQRKRSPPRLRRYSMCTLLPGS
jgi:hypothetical protein